MTLGLQFSWYRTTRHRTGTAHVRVEAVSAIHHPCDSLCRLLCLELLLAWLAGPCRWQSLVGRGRQMGLLGPPLFQSPHTGPQTGGGGSLELRGSRGEG
ncbi:unnamed protein product [Boreogadus saida]